jgi:hypothetical protein
MAGGTENGLARFTAEIGKREKEMKFLAEPTRII